MSEITCPNATVLSRTAVQCSLLPDGKRINRRVCVDCQAQWQSNNPPTRDTMPPALVQIAASFVPVGARSRGLGDTIARITDAVGIAKCGGCASDQDFLNKMVPYKSKPS